MDYSKDITRADIDWELYDGKFSAVDSVLTKGNRAIQNNDVLMELHAKFYQDPTQFGYMFLKDDHGKNLRVYPYQDMLLNDQHRFKYFRAANQIGKSFYFNVKAVHNLILDHGHNHNEAIVSKSLPQAIHQMRRIKGLLNRMVGISWKDEKGGADSMSVVSVDIKGKDGKVRYTNTLICAPCTEGLLGYDLHELNLDEFEYWDIDVKHFFNQIAQPRTYRTKGRITIMSNPNGMDHFGAKLENQCLLDGGRKWHVYVFNYLDCPGNSEDEYNQLKSELSRQEFESTVDAIRSSSDRCFFSPREIEQSYDKDLSMSNMVGKQPFFFLDVAGKFDRACLVGGYIDYPEGEGQLPRLCMPLIHYYPKGYPISRVVGSVSDKGDGWHYVKSVREFLLDWRVGGIEPTFGCDVTGNSGISPLFESVGICPIDVVFSGPSKSGMYQRFKYYMEKGLLHRVDSDAWVSEANQVIVTRGNRGYWLVNATSVSHSDGGKSKSLDAKLKKTPDDGLDATVGLIGLADPRGGQYATASVKVF